MTCDISKGLTLTEVKLTKGPDGLKEVELDLGKCTCVNPKYVFNGTECDCPAGFTKDGDGCKSGCKTDEFFDATPSNPGDNSSPPKGCTKCDVTCTTCIETAKKCIACHPALVK
jgi:hypothetical protein